MSSLLISLIIAGKAIWFLHDNPHYASQKKRREDALSTLNSSVHPFANSVCHVYDEIQYIAHVFFFIPWG